MTGGDAQSIMAVIVVVGLVAALAWLVRRGALGPMATRGRAVTVESAVSLGERRSLVVVAVEGKRLLLGVAPQQITLVAELTRPASPDGPVDPEGRQRP
jgi:flagellar protein FliO/FliZ